MPVLSIYISDETMALLQAASSDLHRSVEDLAEAAVANEALRSDYAGSLEPDLGLMEGMA